MRRRPVVWISVGGLLLAAVIIAATLLLTPQEANPAFAAATDFMAAAGAGDDTVAFALLDTTMQAYVQANCPDGSAAACIAAYIPAEWGAFQSVVFRRAAPDGAAWDVNLIATYAEGIGFSGVCIYQRMARDDAGAWRVAGWAGFISCGDSRSREMATNPDTPNRAP